MSNFLTKIFQPGDFVGLYVVVLIAIGYLWQCAGYLRGEKNNIESFAPSKDSNSN